MEEISVVQLSELVDEEGLGLISAKTQGPPLAGYSHNRMTIPASFHRHDETNSHQSESM